MRPKVSDRQVVLIRERLILYRQVRKARTGIGTVRAVIEDILASDATTLQLPKDGGTARPGAKYDKSYPLKNTSVSEFLTRKRRDITDSVLYEIANFLCAESLLDKRQLENPGRDVGFSLPVAGSITYFRDSVLTAPRHIIEGEYIAEVQHAECAAVSYLLVYNNAEPKLTIAERWNNSYLRASFETATTFINRIDRGTYDRRAQYLGQIFFMSDGSFLLVEHGVSASDGPDGPRAAVGEIGSDALRFDQTARPGAAEEYKRLSSFSKINARLRNNIIENKKSAIFFSKERNSLLNKFIIEQLLYDRIYIRGGMEDESDVNIRHASERLLQAAEADDWGAMIQALIDKADINFRDPETGWTAGHWAAHNSSYDAYAVLVPERDWTETFETAFFVEYPDPQSAKQAWVDATAELDPLQRDNEGYLASMRVPLVWKLNAGPENEARRLLFERMLGVEWRAADRIGVDYNLLMMRLILPKDAPTLLDPRPQTSPSEPEPS